MITPTLPTTPGALLGYTRRGKPIRLIAGGDRTNDPAGGDGGNEPAPSGGQPTPPEPTPEPEPNPDRGFPANTPVSEMTTEQQKEYFKHQSRKSQDLLAKLPTVEEAKRLREAEQELEQLKRQQMSDQERQIAEARDQAKKDVAAEMGDRLAAAEFRAAARGRIPALDALLEDLNLAKFLGEDGSPDLEAIQKRVDALVPAAPEGGQNPNPNPDLEQGAGKPPGSGASVAAGADLYDQYKKRKR